MEKSQQEIREFIKTKRANIYEYYNFPTLEESEYYRQQGLMSGYEEALDHLELFLDGVINE